MTLTYPGMINKEDHTIADAVAAHLETIAHVVDTISQRLQQGGRVIQLGAGTSGRLGVLDASEM